MSLAELYFGAEVLEQVGSTLALDRTETLAAGGHDDLVAAANDRLRAALNQVLQSQK